MRRAFARTRVSLSVRQCAAEDFEPEPCDGPFGFVFAFRVGVLDGRHPEAGRQAPAGPPPLAPARMCPVSSRAATAGGTVRANT
ncbi:hypothetical protein AB0H29_16145 [Streptomyces thermolilacinus]